jgi:hypothetical protein
MGVVEYVVVVMWGGGGEYCVELSMLSRLYIASKIKVVHYQFSDVEVFRDTDFIPISCFSAKNRNNLQP